MLTIKVEKRDPQDTLTAIREKGYVPAVYYGGKTASTPISVESAAFLKVLKEAGETAVVTLEAEDGKVEVLIHEVQLDPVLNTPQHIDFYVVEKGKVLELDIPLVFEGVSPAVKGLGGVLVKVMHDLSVSAEAAKMPQEFVIDISSLEDFDSQILAKDIALPDGVTLAAAPEDVIAMVAAPTEEAEEVPEMDMSAIEVEQKGKKEEEEEAESK